MREQKTILEKIENGDPIHNKLINLAFSKGFTVDELNKCFDAKVILHNVQYQKGVTFGEFVDIVDEWINVRQNKLDLKEGELSPHMKDGVAFVSVGRTEDKQTKNKNQNETI